MLFLNSGGIDSLCTAILLKEAGNELHSLYFNYGQKNLIPTYRSSGIIADKYCVSHEVVELFSDGRFLVPAATGNGMNIPWLNHVTFIMGAVFAESIGAPFLASGLKEDAASDDFNNKFVEFLKTSKIRKTIVPIRPLSNKTFGEIYDIVKDNYILKETWSCNEFPACGVCGKCKLRKEYSID